FGEWGTALRSKFRSDLFFRTTVYVIALQAGLVVISIAAFSWVLHYADGQIISTILSQLNAPASGSAANFSPVIPQSIDAIQNASVQYVFAGMVVVSLLFGTLLAYVTLRPARSTLEHQKRFISNVAHELRTPLSTIKTSTEVAMLDPSLPRDVRKTFAETVIELDRISDIINNLLSLNQFLRPERIGFSNIDLSHVIESVVRRVEPLADQNEIELHTKKHDYSVVWGNAIALEQVISNLVKNSLSYTPKGRHGIVTVSVQPDYRGSILLTVADNGIGIAQKDLFHIFEPFYRADLSRTRRGVRHEGSGLGLAIVSEIVRAHRGSINIQSSLGEGTTVAVTLPAGTTAQDAAVRGGTGKKNKEMVNEVSVDFSKGLRP
ncbi:MAG: sensor histidine kinase, partial [Chthoniobacterales bacterium]